MRAKSTVANPQNEFSYATVHGYWQADETLEKHHQQTRSSDRLTNILTVSCLVSPRPFKLLTPQHVLCSMFTCKHYPRSADQSLRSVTRASQ